MPNRLVRIREWGPDLSAVRRTAGASSARPTPTSSAIRNRWTAAEFF